MSPLPGNSEAEDLQLQVVAAPAEPAHGLRLLLHHGIRAPARQLTIQLCRLPRQAEVRSCYVLRHADIGIRL